MPEPCGKCDLFGCDVPPVTARLVLTRVDGPAHKPTCGHVAGNHHLLPAPPTARAAICCHPVTASDARPPSDTGATGWHTHSGRAAYRDDQCARHDDDANPARPVIVADPAEARETVLRAVHNAVTRRGAGEDWDTDDYHAVTNDVLAALAGQEQP